MPASETLTGIDGNHAFIIMYGHAGYTTTCSYMFFICIGTYDLNGFNQEFGYSYLKIH